MNQTQFCINFVLAILATWRVTHLLAYEDGPADLVARFRILLGDSLLGQLMDCFKCLSIWIAIPAAFFVTRDPLTGFFVWLGLSGAVCLLQRQKELVEAPQYQQQSEFTPSPEFTQTSQGDPSHVLRSEEIGSSEHSILRQNGGSSEAAHPSPTSKQALNGACRS
jgi:hypothetical protein